MGLYGKLSPKLNNLILPIERISVSMKVAPILADAKSYNNILHYNYRFTENNQLFKKIVYTIRVENITVDEYNEIVAHDGEEVYFYPHSDDYLAYIANIDCTEYNKNEKYRTKCVLIKAIIYGNTVTPLSLIVPNDGNALNTGLPISIIWESVRIGQNVLIELYNGTSYEEIATVPVSDFSYDWVVPDLNISNAKIKMTIVEESAINIESPGFSITPLADTIGLIINTGIYRLSLINPTGDIGANQEYLITWDYSNITGDVLIEADIGSGYTQLTTVPVTDLSYSWHIGNYDLVDAKMRITNVDNSEFTDENTFNIVRELNLTSPTGGELYTFGDEEEIVWNSLGLLENVIIELFNGSSYESIDTVDIESSPYLWTVPELRVSNAKIRLTSSFDGSFVEESTNFTIQVQSLELTNPTGAENISSDVTHIITWNQENLIGNVSIQFDDGTGYSVLTIVPIGDESYEWQVPDYDITDAKIKITSVSDSEFTDESAVFNIRPFAETDTLGLIINTGIGI